MGKNDLGIFLREKRESRGMSLRQLASLSRKHTMEGDKPLTYSHISKIETGEASPTLRTLQKIAAALELPLVVVLNGEHVDTESVTVVSTPEFSQILLSTLHREEVVQLILSCHQLTAEQINLLLHTSASLLHTSYNQDEESSS